MRHTPNLKIDRYRTRHPVKGDSPAGENIGYFEIPTMHGLLRIIASDGQSGDVWEHVSVSLATRCPTWEEMCVVKNLFWAEDETVLQFHPQKSQYINFHRFVLHLWRKAGANAELPPAFLV